MLIFSGDFEDDYLIFDCPGQIELYSHIGIMPRLITMLTNQGFAFPYEIICCSYNLCVVYLLDSHFMSDVGKFLAGIPFSPADVYY